MPVIEMVEQAKTLSIQERKQLVKLIVDTLDVPQAETPAPQKKHSILELAGLGERTTRLNP